MIIPYQEIIGNYSLKEKYKVTDVIIPYQEIIGNYSSSLDRAREIELLVLCQDLVQVKMRNFSPF